jgi:hypothetical protein
MESFTLTTPVRGLLMKGDIIANHPFAITPTLWLSLTYLPHGRNIPRQ